MWHKLSFGQIHIEKLPGMCKKERGPGILSVKKGEERGGASCSTMHRFEFGGLPWEVHFIR